MKQRSNCSTSSCEMSSRNGKCRRGSGAKPKPNSPSCSTEGSSRHDGQPGLAHEISDSPARRIDRLPVDEHRVDYAAHLDQLLPITAVAGEARHLPSRNRADLAETDLGHHPFEASPRDAARGRAAEIVVDDRDLGPAETGETIAHSVLQRTAPRLCST